MNRILYNPRLTAKYFISLEQLLLLNYLNDHSNTAIIEDVGEWIEGVTGSCADPFTNLKDHGLLEMDYPRCKLTPKGKAFFAEDTMLSPEEYELIEPVIQVWNDIPETTSHKLKLQDQPQTKTVYKSALIVSSLLAGELHDTIVDCKYQDKPIPKFEAMVIEDIIETIKDYSLKFSPDYYPDNKKNLPTNILDFFMNHLYFRSEFFSVYFDGVMKKKTGTASKLAELGITPKTLRKVYDVMLTPSDRNSESAKYKMMKHLLLVHEQWSALIKELDQYYRWKKSFRDLTNRFDYFILDYVTWIENNINGSRPNMFLQIKDNHEIYAQFRAWYSDKYQINLKVSRSKKEYLMNKTKKHVEGKNG